MTITETRLTAAFEYLDALQESGITNMFGAGPFLRERFPVLDKHEARKVLSAWMDSYSGDPVPARVKKALPKLQGEAK